MKTKVVLFIFFIPFYLSSQLPCEYFLSIDFENNVCIEHLYIDTIDNPNNIWQIGPPQKPVLSIPVSEENVIITDVVDPYPTSDTSSFIISKLAAGGITGPGWVGTEFFLSGYYNINSDSLNDYGTIEFSADNGVTWLDLMNFDPYGQYVYWYDDNGGNSKPTLTGNSNGWEYFMVDIYNLSDMFNIEYEDTLQFKFTFISDSIQNNLDGLMFDNLDIHDFFSDVPDMNSLNEFLVSPNPVSDILNIQFNAHISSALSDLKNNRIILVNQIGQIIEEKQIGSFLGQTTYNYELNLESISSGLYILRWISDDGILDSMRIIKE